MANITSTSGYNMDMHLELYGQCSPVSGLQNTLYVELPQSLSFP